MTPEEEAMSASVEASKLMVECVCRGWKPGVVSMVAGMMAGRALAHVLRNAKPDVAKLHFSMWVRAVEAELRRESADLDTMDAGGVS